MEGNSMAQNFRIAVFNVENLFGRAKVLNLDDKDSGDKILEKIDEFRELLKKSTYNTTDKARILELYNEELKPYILVREDRGKLFKKRGWSITGVRAGGADDWDGSIEFKRDKFSNLSRENTARVIKDVKADVACIIEVENRETLKSFDAHLLNYKYKYEMVIDANDPRGIDVGLYSKYPLGGIWTHMFEKLGGKTIFSRDCLEVEIFLPNGKTLLMLGNHFKSRGYDFDGTASGKRKRQAERVAKILGKYDLTKDWVVVAGDFNDNPDSAALNPLLTVPNLNDVLKTQFPDDPMKRWTYYYDKFEQIDFILVSKPLQDRFRKAGVERRGIYNLKNLTDSSNGLVEIEKEHDTVTHWTNAASDHGAVWAEFTL
jgi:endonuclease/exonuclease/phosphatase family metal-dependent hydrolase